MRKNGMTFALVVMAFVMLLTACGPAATPTAAPVTAAPATAAPATAAPATAAPATEAPTMTPIPTVMSSGEGCAAGAPKINWFVGLGGGTDPAVIPLEKDWVDKYNKSQTYACLVLQVVHNPESYDALRAMIA